MAVTMPQNMIINGAPALWKAPLSLVAGAFTVGTMKKYDNITNPVFTLTGAAAASGAATEEFIQITRGDGAIIEFPKGKLTIDGTDESVKSASGATASGDAKSKMTIAVTFNEPDMDATSFAAWLDFMQKNLDSYWLLCVPLGYNHIQRHPGNATTNNAAGFAFIIAKITGTLSFTVAPQAGAPITLTFEAAKMTIPDLALAKTAIAAATFAAIPVKGITPAITIEPPAGLTATEAEDVLKAGAVIK